MLVAIKLTGAVGVLNELIVETDDNDAFSVEVEVGLIVDADVVDWVVDCFVVVDDWGVAVEDCVMVEDSGILDVDVVD